MATVSGQQSASGEAMRLLQQPTEEDDTFLKPLKRSSCSYEDGCERFRVRERRFQQQYANLYFMRLSRMREMVKSAALNKWGKSSQCFILLKVAPKARHLDVGSDDPLPAPSLQDLTVP